MPDWRSQGQVITFATDLDANQQFASRWMTAKKGQTALGIAASYGHPELATQLAAMNHLHGVTTKLRHGQRLKLPGQFSTVAFNVLCDDIAPQITDGYAVFEVINRPGRVGINKFDGYNPIVMVLSVRFENYQGYNGVAIEQDIEKLERMAGRGRFAGTGQAPPAVVRCSVTGPHGVPMWLIPANYQASLHNPSAPTWRITTLAWDNTAENVLRDDWGRRIRQQCTVTLTQYTPVAPITRSVTERTRAKVAR
jgi:hypothetical protein